MAKIIEITDKSPLVNRTIRVGKTPVEIKTYVDVDTFVSAVHTIADTCFVDGEYRPEYYEIAKRYALLKYMTDIDLGDISVEEIFKVTQNEWYYTIEKECATYTSFYEITQAAKELINHNCKTAFDNLCDNLSATLKQDNSQNLADIKAVLDGLSKVDKRAFAEAVVENNLAKKDGEDNGEKSEGATE